MSSHMAKVAAAIAAATLIVGSALSAQHPLSDLGIEIDVAERFQIRVVNATPFLDPWDIQWGPDRQLWGTERGAKAVIRIDPVNGAKTTLVTIEEALLRDTQDGVLGLALHSGLLTPAGPNYVYVSFVYDADPGAPHLRRMTLRRFTYNAATKTLGSPVDLLTNLPSSDDHAGGRMVFGPDQKIYLTIGDLAANHLTHPCEVNRAQDLPTAKHVAARNWETYQGKILRINLDGSIPADNPLLSGVRSHVFSIGHRNPQGLAVGAGKLYAAEHGPSTDDEVNQIRAGGNYGWPNVAGYQDDRSYVFANWSASAPQPCPGPGFNPLWAPPSVPQQKESSWSHPAFVPPVQSFFAVGPEYDFAKRGNAVIAAAGLDVYTSRAIPGWANSVLVASLKFGTVFRVKLTPDGAAAAGKPTAYFASENRYRDIAISPDGREIFVSIDNWASKENPGRILAFRYLGPK